MAFIVKEFHCQSVTVKDGKKTKLSVERGQINIGKTYRGEWWHTTQPMSSENPEGLEWAPRTERFVLMCNHGITHGHAGKLEPARKRGDRLEQELGRKIHVIRETREVVPDE